MTGQLTAHDVVRNLSELARELGGPGGLIDQIAAAEIEAVNSREDYTLALSKAFLAAAGSMDLRKHLAIEATHEQRLAAELAEAKVRGLRRQIDSVKVRIEVGRSLGTTVRSEMNLAGRDGAI